MIWAGGLILGFLVYQLFGTSVLTNRAQSEAADELVSIFEESRQDLVESGSPLPPASTGESEPVATDEIPTLFPEPLPVAGEPFARISIPDVDLELIVWEGVERDDLKNGPGHMPWTALPGQPGNSVISGHRTTYGAPFFNLDELVPGDEISVETPTGTHTYAVRESIIVAPTAVEVTEPRLGAWLTLTTCDPIGAATNRLVIHAELVDGPNWAFAESLFPDAEGSS